MKLSGLERLMARLCLKIQPVQLEKLVSCSSLSPRVKDTIHSVIKYLKSMRKISVSVEDFISKLKECLNCLGNAHEIWDLLEQFHHTFSDLEALEGEPPHTPNLYRASDQQSMAFNLTLLRISNELTAHHLEILVCLSPTPEAQKEGLGSGIKLFEEMKRHGCIAENDTELLDDLFHELKLTAAETHLTYYKQVCVCVHNLSGYNIYVYMFTCIFVVCCIVHIYAALFTQKYSTHELHSSPSSNGYPSCGSQQSSLPNDRSRQVELIYCVFYNNDVNV